MHGSYRRQSVIAMVHFYHQKWRKSGCVVHWSAHTNIRSNNTDDIVGEAYGGGVVDVPPAEFRRGEDSVGDDHKNFDSEDIHLSQDATVRTIPRLTFMAAGRCIVRCVSKFPIRPEVYSV